MIDRKLISTAALLVSLLTNWTGGLDVADGLSGATQPTDRGIRIEESAATNSLQFHLEGPVKKTVRAELLAMMRILKDEPPGFDSYVDRIGLTLLAARDVLASAEPESVKLATCLALTDLLVSARVELLDGASTARDWIGIARAIEPDAELALPVHLMGEPFEPETSFDEAGFEASLWASEVQA